MFSIFFSMSESQGLALVESWAAGCPTLVYYNDMVEYKNYPIRKCETAPYLTKYTGKYFYGYKDFEENVIILFRAIINIILLNGSPKI